MIMNMKYFLIEHLGEIGSFLCFGLLNINLSKEMKCR